MHFGYEEAETTATYRIYFEFPNRASTAEPTLRRHLGTAFKWRVGQPEQFVLTNYYWLPGLDQSGVLERMAQIQAPGTLPLSFAEGVLRQAIQRQTDKPIWYTEVEEPGNARRSYDLKIYDAGLRVGDLLPLLQRMGSYFQIPEAWFEEFCTGLSDNVVGHLAGGRHRNGEEFVNVYHGLEAFQGRA